MAGPIFDQLMVTWSLLQIPDDDDEELLERVKAKRAQRVSGEVSAERESVQVDQKRTI